MKTIFLDFDGVLNTFEHTELMGRDVLSHRMIDNLNDIIRATNAVIVVSSDWRDGRSVEDLQAILKRHGCIGTVIGTTVSTLDLVGLDDDHVLHNLWKSSRELQILDWLNDHTVDKFAVIDDLDLSIVNFVKVDSQIGLTDSDAQKAIDILKD